MQRVSSKERAGKGREKELKGGSWKRRVKNRKHGGMKWEGRKRDMKGKNEGRGKY